MSFEEPVDTELQNTVAKAWSEFSDFREELTDADVPLRTRMRLFNSVITPSTLYGSASWAMTVAREETNE